MELEKAKNEVLRKIGRNMLLFQKLEQMLKYLITNGKVAGYASEIKEEPTGKGGIRVLYRLKPGWTFEQGESRFY